MENAVFCDIKTHFVTHGKHLSLLQSQAGQCYVRFEVFKVTMKTAVFWDVTPFGSCRNRRFGGSYRLPERPAMKSVTVYSLCVISNR
jgi:hypothetical protein